MKARNFVMLIASVGLVFTLMTGCGGGGGSETSSPPPSSNPPPSSSLTFEKVSEGLNVQNVKLSSSTHAWIGKYNTLMAFDPTGKSMDEMLSTLNGMTASAQEMLVDLEEYQSLLAHYHEYTTTAKSLDLRQSVDPLLIYDLKLLIDKGLKEHEILEQMKKDGYSDIDVAKAMKDKTIVGLKDVTNFGASALFGGGAAAFGGLALGAAGAPVLVVVGGATLVGMAAGAFFSWCTSPNESMLAIKATSEQVCSMASMQTKTVKLPNGETGLALTLPAGNGTLCMHFEGKAPVCINADIKNGGNTLSIGCLADKNDPDMTKECNEDVVNGDGVAVNGEDCKVDVYSVNAVPTSVGTGGATLVVKTVLPTEGCAVQYSLVGTDGYTQADTLTTGASGTATFHVPAGAKGVHDDISVTATESGVATHAGYTF